MATRLTRPAVLSALIIVGYVVLQFVPSAWALRPDTYRYARAAEQIIGADRATAHHLSLSAFCSTRADQAAHNAKLQPTQGDPRAATERACLDRWSNAGDITTTDSRYQAIFSTRPGYPLALAPFVKVFGVADGVRVLGVLIAIIGSLMVAGLLRSVGTSGYTAVAGQVAFLATPLGYWSLQGQAEGLFTLCALGAVWGSVLAFRGQRLTGTLLLVGGYAVGAVTKYSSILVLAGLIGLAALVLWRARQIPRLGALIVAGVSGAAAVLTLLGMRVFELPSTEVTLQDTFTRHFTKPEVHDPWLRLIKLAVRLWSDWLVSQAAPVYLLLAAVTIAALIKRQPVLAALSVALMLTGIVTITAHPLVQEADRLGVLMWVPVALGLPLLAEALVSRTTIVGKPLPERTEVTSAA